MFKKIASCLIVLCLVVCCIPIGAKAAGFKDPKITGVRFATEEVIRPGVVTVEVDVLGEDVGIKSVEVVIMHVDSAGGYGSHANRHFYNSWEGKAVYKGTVKVDIPLNGNAVLGKYVIYEMSVKDSSGNYVRYYSYGDGTADYYNCMKLNGEKQELPTFTLKEEFEFSDYVALSNPNLVPRISNIPDGSAIRILIDDSSKNILPKEAFDAIKGKDVTIVAYKDSYQWIFNGLNITRETKDVDLSLKFGKVDKEDYNTKEDSVEVDFADNGKLPGKAEVRIKTDYLYKLNEISGKLYLYYIKGTVPELQENPNFDLTFDGTDKWCHFTVDHNSTYLISGSKVDSNKSLDGRTPTLSKTRFTYNGKTQKPSVSLKGVSSKYYTVKISSSKNIGKYKVYLVGKNGYTGKTKAVYYTIGPKNPSSVKATLWGHDDVKISWSKVSGATGYVVYYKKASSSTYKKLVDTKSTSYKKSNLSDGVKYDFKVVAYKTINGEKCYNAGKTTSIYTLKEVTNVKAEKSGSKVVVSWANISGESGYQISQSTSKSKTGTLTTYKTTSGKSKTISAKKGKTYYYKVRAYKTVDGKKIYGPWSSVVKYKG